MCIRDSSKIVLLDEATSNIDLVTENIIQLALREGLKESTVLTIAHRLDTVTVSDKILVLSQGKNVEYDTPANLMENKTSIFREMVESSQAQKSLTKNMVSKDSPKSDK
eukprot:TRINITY_DN3988_c0_g1_i5.p1 TRINITY_DN3988_c0_g1~~TRINITY_DN3988_c0_g1_i5.p1  ORF type:complete len:109 (-),score=23.31 TRINITY_DN3988_c0_g1_i5:97-423(-)